MRKHIEDLDGALNGLKEVPDEVVKSAAKHLKADEGMALNLKKCSLFSTSFILDNLLLFNSKFQRDILDLKFQVNVLNEEIENIGYFYRLTFDKSSMEASSEVIRGNTQILYVTVARKCKSIVDKIDAILG